MPWVALASAIIGIAFTCFINAWLKIVTWDGEWLIVSNFTSTDRIPLSNIKEVRAWIILNPNLVWLRLVNDSRFGKTILFMAPWEMPHGLYSEHPLVGQLRGKVAAILQASKKANK